MNESNRLDFSFGSLFPPNMHVMGIAVILGGITSLFSEVYYIGPVIIYVGAWMVFSKSGVQIDVSKKMYREYSGFLFKRGKWKTYECYSDMAVMRGREGYRAYSRGMVELTDSEVVYDIYLLNKDHRSKLILKRCKDYLTAEEEGKDLAERLGLNWKIYSPAISERTRSRRR